MELLDISAISPSLELLETGLHVELDLTCGSGYGGHADRLIQHIFRLCRIALMSRVSAADIVFISQQIINKITSR